MANRLFLRRGIYYVRMMVRGRRLWRSTGRTTLRAAEAEAHRIRAELQDQRSPRYRPPVPTVAEWAARYQQVYSPKKRAPERDTATFRPALQAFGRYQLTEITRSLLVAYLSTRGKGRSPGTVDRERGTLQALFERAVEEGLLDRNPFKGIPRTPPAPRIRLLTEADERALRAYLTPRADRWLTVALGTGLRLGELIGLEERDIQWDRQALVVRAETAKGGKARHVPLYPPVAAALRAQLDTIGVLWNMCPRTYRDVLQIQCRKAGIPHCSPHDLRHTFATRYLRDGGNVYTLSRILGHSSVQMTEKHYVHLVGEDIVARAHREAATLAATPGATPTEVDRR